MARKSLTEILNGRTVFGDYVVIGEGRHNPKNRMILCRCRCGAEKHVEAARLRSGKSRRCKDCAAKSPERAVLSTVHGKSQTSEHSAWSSMLYRCSNQSAPNYHNYGGRGIQVCERWKDSFVSFYEDMGKKPTPSHSLDRIDNDGDYEPGNCRWATNRQQSGNRAVTRKIKINGKEVALADLAREHGISVDALAARLDRGWSFERATTEPVANKRPIHSIYGDKMTTKQIIEKFGVDRQRFNGRLRRGFTPEQAVEMDKGGKCAN